jgi:hypothetical protein
MITSIKTTAIIIYVLFMEYSFYLSISSYNKNFPAHPSAGKFLSPPLGESGPAISTAGPPSSSQWAVFEYLFFQMAGDGIRPSDFLFERGLRSQAG